jgi:hypothetical protein
MANKTYTGSNVTSRSTMPTATKPASLSNATDVSEEAQRKVKEVLSAVLKSKEPPQNITQEVEVTERPWDQTQDWETICKLPPDSGNCR